MADGSCMYDSWRHILAREGTDMDTHTIRQLIVSAVEDVYWNRWNDIFNPQDDRHCQIVRILKQQIEVHALGRDLFMPLVINHTREQKEALSRYFQKNRNRTEYADSVFVQGTVAAPLIAALE